MHDDGKTEKTENVAFVRIPLALIKSQEFKALSMDARMLYGLLMDRACLSARNEWRDAKGFIYVYYTIKAVCEDICCGKEKACKLMAELENAGLIRRHRQGQGKPSRIYVKQFFPEAEKTKLCHAGEQTSEAPENRPQEVGKPKPNQTKKKQKEISYIHSSSSVMTRKKIENKLDYPLLLEYAHGNSATVDAIVSVMAEAMDSRASTLRVGGRDVPRAEVVSVLEELDFTHVEFVLDCMKDNRPDVKNIRSYLLTALYNAPATADAYYDAKIAHDLGW